jgi:DNA-binding response OmpR family regulator
MAPKRRVLLFGRDQVLAELRGKVLESAGLKATVTNHLHELDTLIHNEAFDLLVLCQTLSDRDCVDALEAAKLRPAMKRLVLTHSGRNLPASMFDGECNPILGPESLIRETARVLEA